MAKRYLVQARTSQMVFGAVFFTLCSLVLFWEARHVIGNEQLFLFVLSGTSLLLVASSVFVLVRSRDPREIILETDAITIPPPIFKANVARRIPFSEITKARRQVVDTIAAKHDFLIVHTRDAKHTIVANHLPDGAFVEILQALAPYVTR